MCVAASAAADVAEERTATGQYQVAFSVSAAVAFGEAVKIVGNGDAFGNWSAKDAIPLTWTEGNIWKANKFITAGSYEFKCITTNQGDGVTWEPGENRIVEVPEGSGVMEAALKWGEGDVELLTTPAPASEAGTVPAEPLAGAATNGVEPSFSPAETNGSAPAGTSISNGYGAASATVIDTASLNGKASVSPAETTGTYTVAVEDPASPSMPEVASPEPEAVIDTPAAQPEPTATAEAEPEIPAPAAIGSPPAAPDVVTGSAEEPVPATAEESVSAIVEEIPISPPSEPEIVPDSAPEAVTAEVSAIAEPALVPEPVLEPPPSPADLSIPQPAPVASGTEAQVLETLEVPPALQPEAVAAVIEEAVSVSPAAETLLVAASVVAAATEAIEQSSSATSAAAPADAQEQLKILLDNAPPPASPPSGLKLVAGAHMVPHVDKAGTQGEDAYFVADAALGAVGVADGVSAWAQDGVDVGEYSRTLMALAKEAVDKSLGAATSKQVLNFAQLCAFKPGSATALVAVLKPGGRLDVANLGDCGTKVLRGGKVVFATKPQQHAFNLPFQMSHPRLVSTTDFAENADVYDVEIKAGDIVVAATDGLWDNMWDDELEHLVRQGVASSPGARDAGAAAALAATLAATAAGKGSEKTFVSPFAVTMEMETRKKPKWWAWFSAPKGGKVDDVTVVVAFVDE